MPIATRLEREELEAELKVRSLPEIQLVRSLFEREELDPLLDAVNSVTRRTNRRRWQKPVSGHDGVERWRRVVVTGEDRVLHALTAKGYELVSNGIDNHLVSVNLKNKALTPHMQKRAEGSPTPKSGRVLGPALGDQQQGTFSVNLWKAAFHDTFNRMCPLSAGGHECGCLPVLAKQVMEQCVARLDVAMFNAILRESASEIPTDPISDPIVNPKVLPIPAGDLSFGSGAQLKNSIGNWSRWLTDKLGIDHDDSEDIGEVEDERRAAAETKSFQLLNELSDLLMLPKDMLLEKSIRKEVCPSIGLQLVTRILCNFTTDEFCPDPVLSTVLEELNSELDGASRQQRRDQCVSVHRCPYSVPHTFNVGRDRESSRHRRCAAERAADIGGGAKLDRKASMVQRRGYTSDDDLDDLDSPLASLIDRSTPPSSSNGFAHFSARRGVSMENTRYTLLREVWGLEQW
uniref:Uncharacterized protein n=1 Tax=Zea mays TaxID=4577 RepID=A0A804MKF6_MAIZE